MGALTPDAKACLSATVRELRERLLRDLRDAAEGDYRLAVRAQDAGLAEAPRIRRRRLEDWLDERVRAAQPADPAARREARDRFLDQAVKEAAATLLNRLVLLRHMEALGLVRPAVVTGGWGSPGYRELRGFAPGLLGDDTEGYALLLNLLFDELALDLPGVFGDVGISSLFRVPASTLRADALLFGEAPSRMVVTTRDAAALAAVAARHGVPCAARPSGWRAVSTAGSATNPSKRAAR